MSGIPLHDKKYLVRPQFYQTVNARTVNAGEQ